MSDREILTAVRIDNYKGSGEARVFEPGEEDELLEFMEQTEDIDHEKAFERMERKGHIRGFADVDVDDADEEHDDPDLRATARRRNSQVQTRPRTAKKASTLRGRGKRARREEPEPKDNGEGEE